MNEVTRLPLSPTLPAQTASETEALPQNIEAEQQLLGAILTNNDVFDRVSMLVKAEHFFDPVHRRILKKPPPASRRTRWSAPSR